MNADPRIAELQRENDRLQSQYAELAQLAGSLAHEIKNPLSVIQMNLELLAEEFAEAESPRERRALKRIEVVARQCGRLETLLRDFLKFARVRRLDLKPGDLNAVIAGVLDWFEVQAREAGVEVQRYLDPNLPSILFDEETLTAAMLNLVKNALEAMPDGGVLLVRTYLTRQGVAVDLLDTGCGMDQETALRMFEAFYTTKEGGTGLGLPAARKIIEGHGGTIDVQSELGRGTKFTLQFPAPARIG